MEKIISKLFSYYLSQENVAADPRYAALAKSALAKETQLKNILNEQQIKYFEELLELNSEIHYLEVKAAFFMPVI